CVALRTAPRWKSVSMPMPLHTAKMTGLRKTFSASAARLLLPRHDFYPPGGVALNKHRHAGHQGGQCQVRVVQRKAPTDAQLRQARIKPQIPTPLFAKARDELA